MDSCVAIFLIPYKIIFQRGHPIFLISHVLQIHAHLEFVDCLPIHLGWYAFVDEENIRVVVCQGLSARGFEFRCAFLAFELPMSNAP